MTTPDLEAAGEALMTDLTAAFGTLTADKAAAFFPGLPVDDQIVQNGVVNTLRLAQWLATFDTALVLRPGQVETTVPPGGASATAIYSAIVNGAQAVDATGGAGQQLTQRILADKTLLDQVAPEEPLGSEPPDWPLPDAPSWQTASTGQTQAQPDLADPVNVSVRVLGLGGASAADKPFVTWLQAVGAAVKAGQPLWEVETDKITTEFPAPATGFLLAKIVPDGTVVKVGQYIGVIGPEPLAPEVTVDYQYALVSLTRRVAGTPWWDDVLLSDPTWFIPGRTAGGLLPTAAAGTANALPYALLVVRNVIVSSPGVAPADAASVGPVRVSAADVSAGNAGILSWTGMQAIGVVANVLPSLPPNSDPALPPTTP
jgi:hypothetical protein